MAESLFKTRLKKSVSELENLYFGLYGNGDDTKSSFKELLFSIEKYYKERNKALKALDRKREKTPNWYLKNDLVGMMLYTENFADNLGGLLEHLDYLEESNISYLHLMPLLDVTEGKSDGGYAVSDYRKVQEQLGTMGDLEKLAEECHKKGISICLDYVMNHTSEDHEWAKRARAGEKEYQDRYFFFDDFTIPSEYEKTVPEVFPTTAPGNFTFLEDIQKYVMTSFYPYQWDLNYGNPVVFNEMVYNMLFLANRGIDIIRIDAVPYIWKELGTSCRNLPQVHSLVRMMRIITEAVCPSVIFLGEVVMEPKELAPYFGTSEKPECHLLYNATTMCTLWNTIATRDVRLLRYQTDKVCALPKNYGFVNYIRCHDDIGWGLDYNFLRGMGSEERPHKEFLNDYFLGKYDFSLSQGELYNFDPVTGDGRFCGTTASMCGIEKALNEDDDKMLEKAIDQDLMLHAFLMFQSGIPVIYSGDEIAALNDWSYHDNPLKCEDSRYIHRGKLNWDDVGKRADLASVQSRIYNGLLDLENIRAKDEIFNADVNVYTIETHNNSVLGMIRIAENKRVVALFNFSDAPQTVTINEFYDGYRDFPENEYAVSYELTLKPYGYKMAVWEN